MLKCKLKWFGNICVLGHSVTYHVIMVMKRWCTLDTAIRSTDSVKKLLGISRGWVVEDPQTKKQGPKAPTKVKLIVLFVVAITSE